MPKLTFEVESEPGAAPVTRIFLDGEQLGLVQSVEFSADKNELLPKLRMVFPDTDVGWGYAELVKQLAFAEVTVVPLEEG